MLPLTKPLGKKTPQTYTDVSVCSASHDAPGAAHPFPGTGGVWVSEQRPGGPWQVLDLTGPPDH